ncbi:hypothetical protein [Sphingopyxis granuli]|uniref:hypothetical protein n=1 Tax=Sphingopyxis granuli TaxID=267128 RepID=UPI001BAFF298|nr:hypothetical protein [Sphingopyxis granuli]QUM71558.1 hypothetical protein ICN83_14630 [Sphingopyxis granuli]
MNASQAPSASGPSAPVAPAGPLPADGGSSDLFWSLQYCRASALSLTRLELALASSDRQRIVEAIDRLHALDREIERRVASLPPPPDPDPEREAIDRHLDREKMAVAFEKLALASGISGPALASPPAFAARTRPEPELSYEVDGPPFDRRRTHILASHGPKIALLLAIAAATAALLATAF